MLQKAACLTAMLVLATTCGAASAKHRAGDGHKGHARKARAQVSRRGARAARKDFLRKLGQPVSLHVRRGRLVGPVKLRFPIPAKLGGDGQPLDDTVQLA